MWDVSDAYIVRTLINNQQKCPRMRMDLGWNWWFQQCFNLFSVFILDIYSVPFIHHTVPNRSSIPFLWLGDWYDVSLGEYCRDHIKTALFGGVLQLFWKILSDKRCSQRLFSSLRIRHSYLVVTSIMIISFLSFFLPSILDCHLDCINFTYPHSPHKKHRFFTLFTLRIYGKCQHDGKENFPFLY